MNLCATGIKFSDFEICSPFSLQVQKATDNMLDAPLVAQSDGNCLLVKKQRRNADNSFGIATATVAPATYICICLGVLVFQDYTIPWSS